MIQKVMILGLFLLLFLLLLHFPSIFAAATDDVGHYCPVNGFSYTAGSTFQANLNTTLYTHLISNASRAPFTTFSIGTGVDKVYAMYYCRGDASLKTCHNCVETAAGRILDVCRFLKQGIVWYKECTLRYANETIFAITDEDLRVASPVYNTTQVLGNYLDKYKSIFDTGMRNLINQVANNVSLKPQGFATIRVNLSSFQTLHGVAQCAPMITGMSCERCLDAGLRLMDLWTNSMEFLPACFIGFDINGFPPPTPPTPSPSLPVGIKVLISLISFVVILSLVGGFWLYKRRSSKGDPHPPPARAGNEFFFQQSDEYDQSIIEEDLEPSEKGKQRGLAQFSYSEVEEMTNGFQKRIGEGGFAVVYYGVLPYSSKEVAVKMFWKNEAPKQFSTEIEVLGRIAHKNLVSLLGYCEEGTNLALVYEYMTRGDLKALLNEYSDELSWRKRVEIAIDTAQGLDYLHNGCSPPIVHRDVKPANILLNKDFRAMLSDFGFSKIFPAEYVSNLQSRVVGTLGYLDPQYNLTGNVSEKGDIYSFGVVLLELITGKTAIVNRVMNLGQWVRSILETGDIVSILDPSLRQDVSDNCTTVWKTVELAVRCIHLEAAERPSMAQIVSELKECLTMMDTGASTFAKTPSLENMSAALLSRTMSPTPR